MKLKDRIEKFYSEIEQNGLNEKSLSAAFKNLAPAFLYGGYIDVYNEFRVYIRTVEFYFHDEKERNKGVIDPIVYHRNGRLDDIPHVPNFPLLSLQAHASGFDITFERGDFRASALIRKYAVMYRVGDTFQELKRFRKSKESVKIYKKLNKRDTPTERRSNNTVANEMQVLRAFFTELEDTEEISRSPFRKISRDRRVILTRKKYDDPIFLRKEEFEALRNFKPAKTLEETKEAFLLHCALGCRIGDFQRFTMDNVGVSEEGIPYIHYLPEKTKGTQKDNSETITPLVRYAFDIIKRTHLNLPILKYPSGKSGYNKKIKQLLKAAGIDRKVTEFDEVEGVNKYIPICETSSSKLARSTHVDMMNKVQINIYAAGLHRQGSGAVTHYTMLELADRFKLMNLAFNQEDYRVDKNLEVIPMPKKKDS